MVWLGAAVFGLHVVWAYDNAPGAIARAPKRWPGSQFTVGLPVIDGWEATARLKRGADTRHIPIIVLSAHAMTSDREQALAAGGDDFDTKPVQFQRLLEKIGTLLARGEQR